MFGKRTGQPGQVATAPRPAPAPEAAPVAQPSPGIQVEAFAFGGAPDAEQLQAAARKAESYAAKPASPAADRLDALRTLATRFLHEKTISPLGDLVLRVYAAPSYLQRCGAPQHPTELEGPHHHTVGFVWARTGKPVPYTMRKQLESLQIKGRYALAVDDGNAYLAAGLAGDEALGGLEAHHLLDGIELELFQLGLALGLVVQLAGDGTLDQIQGGGLQLVGGDHGIDGAFDRAAVEAAWAAVMARHTEALHTLWALRSADAGTLTVLAPDFDSRTPVTADLSANSHGRRS